MSDWPQIDPARDHGISSLFPGFGALNGTDRTALLQPDLAERCVASTADNRDHGLAGRENGEVDVVV